MIPRKAKKLNTNCNTW